MGPRDLSWAKQSCTCLGGTKAFLPGRGDLETWTEGRLASEVPRGQGARDWSHWARSRERASHTSRPPPPVLEMSGGLEEKPKEDYTQGGVTRAPRAQCLALLLEKSITHTVSRAGTQ